MPLNEYSNDFIEGELEQIEKDLKQLKMHLQMFPETGQYRFFENIEKRLKGLLY
jgi:hypothetical protein